MKNTTSISEIPSYSANYSETSFWNKIRSCARHAGKKLVYSAFVLYYELKDPTVSFKERMVIYGALGYLILPVDLIPDWIAVIGYTDDMAVLMKAVSYISDHVTPYVKRKATRKCKDLLAY